MNSTDDFDVTYFIYNQVETISKAVQLLNEYVDKKQKDFYDFMDWASKSSVSKQLNWEQLEILKEAVRSPGREFTAKQMSDDFGMTSNTARKYLNELVDLDLLVQSIKKIGKAVVYLAPANLKSKLNL